MHWRIAATVALTGLCPALATVAAETSSYTRASLIIADPVPVVVWNRTIVEYRAGIAGETAERRAARSEERIARIPYEALSGPIETVAVSAGELSGLQILVGTGPVITLIQEDLPPESELSLEQYAEAAVVRLREVFEARAQQRSPEVLLRAVGLTLLAIAIYWAVLYVLLRVRRRAQRTAAEFLAQHPVRLVQADIRPVLRSLVQGLGTLLALGIVVAMTYALLTFVFAQYPYSQPISSRLGDWLVGQLRHMGASIQHALPGVFTAILIFFMARLIVRAVGGFFDGIENRVISVSWLVPATARTTRVLISALIWVFALVFAYPYIPGSGTDAFKGISVLLGLMISLGSAGMINQFMSGLVIVYSRALSVGDFAKIGDVSGVVTRVGLLSTRLMTSKEELVTIPNAVVVGNRVTSHLRAEDGIDAQLGVAVTIGYDASWRQVHELLLQAAASAPGIRKMPAPYVLQRALSDFYVEYELRVKVEPGVRRFQAESDLNAAIQDTFNDAGVQIMSPHFESQPAQKVCAGGPGATDPSIESRSA